MTEEILWKGRSSQWVNVVRFTVAGLIDLAGIVGAYWYQWSLVVSLVALVWMLWQYLVVRCRYYEMTSQRLRIGDGVLNQTIDELELYRVKDISIERPFWLRLVKLSTLVLSTSDRSHPEIRVSAIKDGNTLRDTLRRVVEELRDQKRVREMDFTAGEVGKNGMDAFDDPM